MYKMMITTHDSGEEAFCIEDNFDTEGDALIWWYGNADQYPEMTDVWAEIETIVDEFGAEAAANVMGVGDEFDDDYLLDNGTHL